MKNKPFRHWKKRGRIYEPGQFGWARRRGLTPTPVHFPQEKKIRVYFCSTDEKNVGRVGFVDVSSDDPDNVLHVHPEPVLDVGEPGLYNDSGVAPTSFLSIDGRDLLYIFGYQRCEKLGALMFAGLAEKAAEEEKFRPLFRAPILPRTPDRPFMQSAPTVIKDGERYRMWYPYVSEWRASSLRSYPVYQIGHAHSIDGVNWTMDDMTCLPREEGEIGLGRPWVIKTGFLYEMWFSSRRLTEAGALHYAGIGHAVSEDGFHWQRDENLCLTPSGGEGWDSEMVCYGAVLDIGDRRLMFHCGNNNGETGFGWAEEIVP